MNKISLLSVLVYVGRLLKVCMRLYHLCMYLSWVRYNILLEEGIIMALLACKISKAIYKKRKLIVVCEYGLYMWHVIIVLIIFINCRTKQLPLWRELGCASVGLPKINFDDNNVADV